MQGEALQSSSYNFVEKVEYKKKKCFAQKGRSCSWSHVTFLNCYKHLSNRKGEIQEKFKINSKIIIETNK